MFGIRCASVCYVPYGDLANHTLLSHRRHPALFARFDEANSRFAFAFAFRTICAHDSGRRHLFVRLCVRVCGVCYARCKHGAHVGFAWWYSACGATPALLHHCFGNSKHAHAAGRVAAASCNAVSIYPTVGPARFNRPLNDLEKKKGGDYRYGFADREMLRFFFFFPPSLCLPSSFSFFYQA